MKKKNSKKNNFFPIKNLPLFYGFDNYNGGNDNIDDNPIFVKAYSSFLTLFVLQFITPNQQKILFQISLSWSVSPIEYNNAVNITNNASTATKR